MRVLMYRFFMLALGALAALMRPVTRATVHLAGRLSSWHDQAEICWLISIVEVKLRRKAEGQRKAQQSGGMLMGSTVHWDRPESKE